VIKTTFALQYLLEGLSRGEKCLYVTLSETREELVAGAQSHGWSIEVESYWRRTRSDTAMSFCWILVYLT
jgi:circadian clock protein KaiC